MNVCALAGMLGAGRARAPDPGTTERKCVADVREPPDTLPTPPINCPFFLVPLGPFFALAAYCYYSELSIQVYQIQEYTYGIQAYKAGLIKAG